MLKCVYLDMAWFKMKLQQFSKCNSYSIKMQINTVFFSPFHLPRHTSLVIRYICNTLGLVIVQDMIFLLKHIEKLQKYHLPFFVCKKKPISLKTDFKIMNE